MTEKQRECYARNRLDYEVFQTHLKRAKEGIPEEEWRVGWCYETGRQGSDPDIDEALEWYRRAEKHGYAKAGEDVARLGGYSVNGVVNRYVRVAFMVVFCFILQIQVASAAEATFSYSKCDDGIVITHISYIPTQGGELRIPDSINGVDVVEIGQGAYEAGLGKYDGVRNVSLRLPKGLKRISSRAFINFPRIEEVFFPEKLEQWGRSSFCSKNNGVVNLKMPAKVIILGSIPSVVGDDTGTISYAEFYVEEGKESEYIKTAYTWRYDGHVNNIKTGFVRVQIEPFIGHDQDEGATMQISCANTAAKIYYTLDGSDPATTETSNCFLYKAPVLLQDAAKVRALAYVAEYPYTVISEQDYAFGQIENVTVNSEAGDVFDHRGNKVYLTCSLDAEIRYSLDGSQVNDESPVYSTPLVVSDTTQVRARAYKKWWFPSEEVVQTFTRVWYTNETPVISAESATFDFASQEVTISCATEGTTVYYTIDGSEPSAANGRVYKGPFSIYDSVTVKAIAVKEDWKDSAVASAAFTKNNGLSAAINMYDYLPDNDANAPWTVDKEVSHDGVSSARSGAIGENGVATMKVTLRGAGRLSFWWKSECEAWDEDYYDYGAFCVGSETEPRLRIAGMTDWKREEIVFDGMGEHVCKWEYHKDDEETIPRDCIWVDQVQWLPYGESEHDHTLTTEVPVPYLWLDSYGLGRESDFETAAKMKLGKVDGAGRAMSVEDDYVAGTDPTNLASKLTATIKMGADGKPILSWKPPLNGEDADGAGIREGVRSYSVYGKQTLDDAAEKWTPVAEGDEGKYRFFKVGVGMPE